MNVFITIFHPSFSPDWFVLILFWLKLNWFDLVKNECLHCIHFPSSDSPEWFRLVYFDFIVSLELPSCLHLWQSRLVWRLRTPSFSPRDDPFTLLWMRTMNDLCLMAHIYGSIRKMGKSWLHFLMSMNLRQRMIYNETFDGTVQIQLLLLLLLHSTSTSTVVTLANKKSFTILIKFAALKFMGQKLTSIVSSAQQRHHQPFLDSQRARSWKTTKIATFTLSWEIPSIRNEDAS